MTARASTLPVIGSLPPLALAVRTPTGPLSAESLLTPRAQLSVAVTPLLLQSLIGLGAVRRSSAVFELRDLTPDDPRLAALARLLPASVWAPAATVPAARAAGGFTALDQRELRATSAQLLGVPLPAGAAGTSAARVLIRRTGRRLLLRVSADRLVLAGVDLSTACTPARRPARVLPHVALLAVDEALARGLLVVDADGRGQVQQLRRTLQQAIVVLPSASGPGLADVVTGAGGARDAGGTARSVSVQRSSAASAAARPGRLRAVHPEVADVAAMAAAGECAVPGPDGGTLRDYQQRAVALHTATRRGYVNLAAPGLGKSIMALVGMRARALEQTRWRGLVTCPAAVREQWAAEAARWFPEATVTVVRSHADVAETLPGALTGTGLQLVVISHELLPAAGPVLLRGRLEDLICDEALLLRNPTSVRGRLLWQLRRRADVAVALTGSPPGAQLGQVTALAAWCRDRPELLIAPPPTTVAELADLLGPVLFRQDQRALDGEVDVAATEVVAVVASAEERAAAAVALTRLAEALHAWRSAPPARAARLRPAATAALSSARAAMSDPLAGSGPGTKRAMLVSLVAAAHARDERVLVFTDVAASARAALADLAAAEVSAAGLLGGQSPAARARTVAAFLGGDVRALVVTPAGQEGLNLQVADLVVHLDVPFEVAPLLQRQSRARRIGGTTRVRATALVTAGVEETAARQVLAELSAELSGAGRLEGGAAPATALERAAALFAGLPAG